MHPEPLDVVIHVVEGMNFQLAAVARTGIHLPDGEAALKASVDDRLEPGALPFDGFIPGSGRDTFGEDAGAENLRIETQHRNLPKDRGRSRSR
jgi:hypothetical protein